jgi:hypothetical protein
MLEAQTATAGSEARLRRRRTASMNRSVAVKDLCRKRGFSEASYYLWRSKFGSMSVSDAKRLNRSEPRADFDIVRADVFCTAPKRANASRALT